MSGAIGSCEAPMGAGLRFLGLEAFVLKLGASDLVLAGANRANGVDNLATCQCFWIPSRVIVTAAEFIHIQSKLYQYRDSAVK